MSELNYWTGVLFAILSGVATNIGTILQKKVVNELSTDTKLMGNLIRNKLWLLGLLLGFVVGAIFYMIAQSFIGPALILGLMNSGLIVLAIVVLRLFYLCFQFYLKFYKNLLKS